MIRSVTRRKQSSAASRFVFGGILLLAALGMLWFNEGRTNLAEVAAKSAAMSGDQPAPQADGQFVSVSGWLTSDGILGDDRFIRAGDYVYLEREVEMYAWVEKASGSIQTDDTADSRYQLEWTSDPQAANEFEVPRGHENPPLPVEDLTLTANQAQVGIYAITPSQMAWPHLQPLALDASNVVDSNAAVSPEYLYLGTGTLDAPQLGDVRISYWVVYENIWVTVFGTLGNGRIQPYIYDGDKQLYRTLEGDRAAALAQLQTEYKNLLWGFRIGGVFLLWFGFMLLLSPLTNMLALFPPLQRLGRKLTAVIALLLALVLGISTSAISAIVHHLWAVLLLLFVLFVAGFFVWQQQNRQS
ncbi:MAG: hypothetical protein H6662_05040 [Ardenticatenaceae bacterium]|nr:hypothetical protein [Anaerolineales bacterium]MCB8920932.1 hypothetical protein [Ardenticatenaceae bacterium]MCB9005509.1 hypothetical protein [Ardenticatenaceae bacterium]